MPTMKLIRFSWPLMANSLPSAAAALVADFAELHFGGRAAAASPPPARESQRAARPAVAVEQRFARIDERAPQFFVSLLQPLLELAQWRRVGGIIVSIRIGHGEFQFSAVVHSALGRGCERECYRFRLSKLAPTIVHRRRRTRHSNRQRESIAQAVEPRGGRAIRRPGAWPFPAASGPSS